MNGNQYFAPALGVAMWQQTWFRFTSGPCPPEPLYVYSLDGLLHRWEGGGISRDYYRWLDSGQQWQAQERVSMEDMRDALIAHAKRHDIPGQFPPYQRTRAILSQFNGARGATQIPVHQWPLLVRELKEDAS